MSKPSDKSGHIISIEYGEEFSCPDARNRRPQTSSEEILREMSEWEIDQCLDAGTEMCRPLPAKDETRKRKRDDQDRYNAGFAAGLEEGLKRAEQKLAAVKDEMAKQLENMKEQEELKIEAARRQGKKEGTASMRNCYATVSAAAQRAHSARSVLVKQMDPSPPRACGIQHNCRCIPVSLSHYLVR